MEGRDEIDMDNNETKYCVSWVTRNVVSIATHNTVESWNNHCIPCEFSETVANKFMIFAYESQPSNILR
jgi:hypothetical protein